MPSLSLAVERADAEERPGLLSRIHRIRLLRLRRVIAAPEPGHLLREFGAAVGRIVRAVPEAEMKIVLAELERVRHLYALFRPSAESSFVVVRAILQPQ